jgi:hypothetical protein
MKIGSFSSQSHPWTLEPIAEAGLIGGGVKSKRRMPIAIREVHNLFGLAFGTFRRRGKGFFAKKTLFLAGRVIVDGLN